MIIYLFVKQIKYISSIILFLFNLRSKYDFIFFYKF